MSTRASTRLDRDRPTAEGPWRLTLLGDPDDCNLRCTMCPCGAAPRRPPRRMDPALATAVLDGLAGTGLREVIPSTMGEPLLWAGMDALVDRCASHGLQLNLTTNGTWPGRGAEAWARRLAPVASDVKISVNGATPATAGAIMAGLRLEDQLEGARILVGVRDEVARAGGRRFGVSFQVTAQAANVAEVPAIVRLAAEVGADRVKLNHLQPRPGLPWTVAGSLRRDAAGIRRWNEAVREARRAAAGTPLRLENAVELGDEAPRGPCPFLGREAWILPDGRLAPCPHPAAWEGALGELGSARERPLAEIWKGPRLAALLAAWPGHAPCRDCRFRSPGGA